MSVLAFQPKDSGRFAGSITAPPVENMVGAGVGQETRWPLVEAGLPVGSSFKPMTWVETLLVACLAGIITGLKNRRTRVGRSVLYVSLTVLIAVLAVFGREFVWDLL